MTLAKQPGKRWRQRSVVLTSLAALVLGGRSVSGHEDHGAGGMGGPSGDLTAKHAGAETQEPPPATIYICPMHPDERSTKPGRCPRCGMNLVPTPRAGS